MCLGKTTILSKLLLLSKETKFHPLQMCFQGFLQLARNAKVWFIRRRYPIALGEEFVGEEIREGWQSILDGLRGEDGLYDEGCRGGGVGYYIRWLS